MIQTTEGEIMSDHRVADYAEIRAIYEHAQDYDLNRQIPGEVFRKLDKNGWHILTLVIFSHERGIPGDPMHHRVSALLKLKGQRDPYTMYLDVLHEDFSALKRAGSGAEAKPEDALMGMGQ